MISEEEWLALLPFVNQVCSRETDLSVISEGRIQRWPGEHITVLLHQQGNLHLEPGEVTSGPGWPD